MTTGLAVLSAAVAAIPRAERALRRETCSCPFPTAARTRSSPLLCASVARGLFSFASGAVDFLHQRRIDIKPDNCLLTDGTRKLKLTDFNSAKVIGQGEGSAAMLSDRGTKDFAAPELLLGGLWNERVDIWASGLCLCFMLQGSHPWNSLQQAKKAFAAGCLPPVDWTCVEPNTADLLQSCLVVNPFNRPPAMKILNHGAFQGSGIDVPPATTLRHDIEEGRTKSKPRNLAQTYGALCSPGRRVSYHGYVSSQMATWLVRALLGIHQESQRLYSLFWWQGLLEYRQRTVFSNVSQSNADNVWSAGDQRLLSFTSTLSVLAVMLVFALMTSVFMQDHEASLPICMAGLSWGSVSMFASMMQTVVLQMCVLPMYGEMRNRSPGAFAKVVYWGFAVLFIVCASFALLGYFTFGSAVKSNVLLSLPTSRAGNLARLCAGASVVGVYPIILKPMIATLYRPGEGHDGLTTHWATGSVVAGVMMASLVLSDLGKLNIFNGAVSMGVFVAIVPFLVGCNLLQRFQQAESAKLALYVLLVLGLIGSVLALILDDNYAKELASVCAWPAAKLSAQ
ncbi:STY13 [Symbiodinium sp. CCMP2456]|nr:STY13 [Symbiodinium sp. CCMP2456]